MSEQVGWLACKILQWRLSGHWFVTTMRRNGPVGGRSVLGNLGAGSSSMMDRRWQQSAPGGSPWVIPVRVSIQAGDWGGESPRPTAHGRQNGRCRDDGFVNPSQSQRLAASRVVSLCRRGGGRTGLSASAT